MSISRGDLDLMAVTLLPRVGELTLGLSSFGVLT